MRTRALGWIPALVLGLALVHGGCQKSSNKSKKKAKTASADRSIPKTVQVKLLGAGTGAKTPLRYRFRAPETHRVVVTITMSVGVTTEERSVPVQRMPAMEMQLTLTHQAVSKAGVLKYAFQLTRAGLTGVDNSAMGRRFSKTMGAALKQLAGLKGSGEATARGLTTMDSIKLPASIAGEARKAAQSLQEQLQRLAVALPEQAVGVGARWEVRQPLQRATVRMGQTATYTLAKRQGSRVTFDVTLVQFAPQQELNNAQLPRGATAVLHSLRSSGTGRFEIDLTRPAPRGTLRYQSVMDQTVSAGGKSQRMQINMRFQARFATQAPSTN